MQPRLLPILLALLIANPLVAQVATEGSDDLDLVVLKPPSAAELRRADEERVAEGRMAHFAAPLHTELDPRHHGRWRPLERGLVEWRLRLAAPGARSLALEITRLNLPPEAVLQVTAPASGEVVTFSPAGAQNRRLSPPMLGDLLELALLVPIESSEQVELRIARVFYGYAGFGENTETCLAASRCADERAEVDQLGRAVALLVIEGVRFCTGFLVNNSAQDHRNLLMTAAHCGINARNAAAVIAVWDYARPSCAAKTPAASSSFQQGARIRARHGKGDVLLLELDSAPPQPRPRLGWDRNTDEPAGTLVLHHPAAGERSLARDLHRPRTTDYLSDLENAAGNSWRIGGWEVGSTDGGSSGAPLFADGLVIGILRGGFAACGNHEADWFTKIQAAWDGAGPSERLRDWLDPLGQEPMVLETLLP